MVLITKDGTELELFLGEKPDNVFFLENKEKGIKKEMAYILSKKDEFSPERYFIFIFHNNELPENYIFQLYEKNLNKRIGWIFPLQALSSNKHSYSNNEHFLKIAFPAFINLISSVKQHYTPEMKDSFLLDDFYSPGSIILILDKEEINQISSFNIDDYIPNLYQYGYLSKPYNIKLNKNIEYEFYEDNTSKSIRTRISIAPISSHLKNDYFIYQLFKELLGHEEGPPFRFYLLYQIIELLIRRIFNHQFNTKIISVPIENQDLFDMKDKLQEMASEKKRINLLFNEYAKVNSPELYDLLSDFLSLREQDKAKNTLADLLYKVRSFLVHNYRQIEPKQVNLMGDINFYFERIIIYLLINYKEI